MMVFAIGAGGSSRSPLRDPRGTRSSASPFPPYGSASGISSSQYRLSNFSGGKKHAGDRLLSPVLQPCFSFQGPWRPTSHPISPG
ncbi:Hypothetical predicted protein [Podarcis lilfordi]|uniref:Uncharacterized protein n=1 Tax=Podarcis lilfordi TaxID=74358 RepID=A0AA35PVA6_9SAUR|nr:Hypothetical predicted protein [Podarcis lilfordi]